MKDNLVYITEANSKRILNSITVTKLNLNGEIYKTPIYFFNKFECKSLLLLKEFFMNPQKFFNEYYKFVEPQDASKFIFFATAPSYHVKQTCDRLNSDYVNYLTPSEVLAKGSSEVLRFKMWCASNKYLIDENKKDVFFERCRLAFGLKITPKMVEYNNSGVTTFKNYTIKQIEEMIDNLHTQAPTFFNRDTKTNTILRNLSKYAYLAKKNDFIFSNNTEFSDDEVKKVLLEFDTKFKQPIYRLLREWYRVKYNRTVALDVNILESIGFHACSTCKN
jgi:hypothetical protein